MRKKLIIKRFDIFYFWIFYIISVEFFISFGILPSGLRYISDAINLFIFFYSFSNRKLQLKFVSRFILVFLLYCLFVLIIFGNSFLNFLWGARCFLSAIIFFSNCYFVLCNKDTVNVEKFIIFVFYLDVVLSVFEYALGYVNDFNGGIFGVSAGCNSGQNILLIIACIVKINQFREKKASVLKVMQGCIFTGNRAVPEKSIPTPTAPKNFPKVIRLLRC